VNLPAAKGKSLHKYPDRRLAANGIARGATMRPKSFTVKSGNPRPGKAQPIPQMFRHIFGERDKVVPGPVMGKIG
jgi:hypothetical protein